jgi:hypothetical protein
MDSSRVLTAVSLCIAIYAAALSTFIAFRDRLKVKISFSRETEYFEEEGVGSVGETHTVVVVANAGRRPVTITNVRALRLFPKSGFAELACKPIVPVELKENQRLVAWASDEQVDIAEVDAWEARDALDNPHRKNVAPWSTRMWSRLRIIWVRRTR